MKTVKERKKEILEHNIIWLTLLLILWACLVYFEYGFENLLWNGIILFLSTFLLSITLKNEGYYIETGYEVGDKNHQDIFKTYCQMNPWKTLYNKLLSILTIIMFLTTIVIIVTHFFV